MTKLAMWLLAVCTIAISIVLYSRQLIELVRENQVLGSVSHSVENTLPIQLPPHPLSIQALKEKSFPGSDFKIEQTLAPGSNYNRYIASYESEGLTIYGLLTVPQGEKPGNGWPTIIFNHGYIPPAEYKTTERYVSYMDGFARKGYIVFKPDYRGHGNSEGAARGGYGSNDYTIDVLNAVASLKKYDKTDPTRIGMWGHSMGGFITLRAMVASPDIKAGVIWGGVVGSYAEMLENWRHRPSPSPTPVGTPRWRELLSDEFGTPEENPQFWNSISATSYLDSVSGPIQLHHGTADESVPIQFSRMLFERLNRAGKIVEYYEYPGDNHNLTEDFTVAMNRSVNFFDKYLKS